MGVSIDDYIKELDREQLYNLVDKAEEKISDIERQQKIKLVLISGCNSNMKYFRASDLENAKKYIVSLIDSDDCNQDNLSDFPQLKPFFVYESELAEYLED